MVLPALVLMLSPPIVSPPIQTQIALRQPLTLPFNPVWCFAWHGFNNAGSAEQNATGMIRRNGRLLPVPLPGSVKSILAVRSLGLLSWGDDASAYYSTTIPNIEVYLQSCLTMLFFTPHAYPLAAAPAERPTLFTPAGCKAAGPSPTEREQGSCQVVEDSAGAAAECCYTQPMAIR